MPQHSSRWGQNKRLEWLFNWHLFFRYRHHGKLIYVSIFFSERKAPYGKSVRCHLVAKMDGLLVEDMAIQEHGFNILICVTLFAFLLALSILVNFRIKQMISNNQERAINGLIRVQQRVLSTLCPIFLASTALRFTVQNPSSFISDYGCYFISFTTVYVSIFLLCQSFFITLFRYLLIVHNALCNRWDLTPKVKIQF